MIDYTLFCFSTPPMTGSTWFVKAAQLAGLGWHKPAEAVVPFHSRCQCPLKCGVNKPRVSLVRHPCDWLALCYMQLKTDSRNYSNGDSPIPFDSWPVRTFSAFVRAYLEERPGYIGELYAQYDSDVCLRVEDLPLAFGELMDSVGVDPLFNLYLYLNVRKPNLPQWDRSLRYLVTREEGAIFERYEYY